MAFTTALSTKRGTNKDIEKESLLSSLEKSFRCSGSHFSMQMRKKYYAQSNAVLRRKGWLLYLLNSFMWLVIKYHKFKYIPWKMVFCYQNCSDLLWEKIVLVIKKKLLKFEAEGQEFVKFLRSLEQFIQTVNGQNNFW